MDIEAIQFRDARLDDLPAIVTLLAQDTIPDDREDPSLPLDPRYVEAYHAIARSPDHRQIVAELDGRVVGTLQLTFLPGISFRGRWRGQIEAVRVAAELRSQGLGARMVDWAVELCRQRGCFMAQLMSAQTRLDAHRFYERHGWQKTHFGFKLTLEEEG